VRSDCANLRTGRARVWRAIAVSHCASGTRPGLRQSWAARRDACALAVVWALRKCGIAKISC